jgi:hypothetical protein
VSPLAYPFGVKRMVVRLFDVVGGWDENGQLWMQTISLNEDSIGMGEFIFHQDRATALRRTIEALKKQGLFKELNHWIMSPKCVIDLWIDGEISLTQLQHAWVSSDQSYIVIESSFGKIVVISEPHFPYAPADVLSRLIPIPRSG